MASLELPSTGAFFEAMCVAALTPEKACSLSRIVTESGP